MTASTVPPIIRGIHWAVVTIVVLNVFVLPAGGVAHRILGLIGAALVVSRLLLFFKYRMTYFNPAAVVVYWLIWFCVLGLGGTGVMMQLDTFWDDYATLTHIHTGIVYFLLALALAHLAGIGLDALRNHRKTWMKMISGR